MKNIYKHACLLLLVSFIKVNARELEDYSKMSSSELGEAFVSAVKKDDQGAVKKLMQAGVDINTPIPYTYTSGDCDWNVESTPLMYAATKNRPNIVKLLTKEKKELVKALYVAIEEGNLEVLEALIEAGADVNCENANKNTPLIVAVSHARATAEFSLQAQSKYLSRWEKRRSIIQALLKAGAKVTHANKDGKTALMEAVEEHDLHTVQNLLQVPEMKTGSFFGLGTKPINYADNDGNTALILAMKKVRCSYINNQEYQICINSQKIIKTLLETPGINAHRVNKQGETAIKLLKQINERVH